MMKNNILISACLVLMLLLSSCDDFFDVNTDSMLDGSDYMKESNEMYTGYIGLFSRLQAVADKPIYLTDTRGEFLTLTSNTPRELVNVYSYADDLTDNPYADPAGYYDVIIGCNDYLSKVREFKNKNVEIVDMDHYRSLVSGAIRIKTWAYFMLGKIYGQAVWFDDPLINVGDLSSFPVLNLTEIINRSIDYLNTGFDGISGNVEMFSWEAWLKADQNDTSSSDEDANSYIYWDLATPPYFVLAADLYLWRGEQSDFRTVINLVRTAINNTFLTKTNKHWKIDFTYNRYYNRVFDNNLPNADYAICAIPYFSQKGQINDLKRHFDVNEPNEYLLGVNTQVVMNRYWTENPMTTEQLKTGDRRFVMFFDLNDNSTSRVDSLRFVKYFQDRRTYPSNARSQAYRWDTPVNLYRSTELYLMLIEAYVHLGDFRKAKTLLNKGISVDYGPESSEDFSDWVAEGYTAPEWLNNGGLRLTGADVSDKTFEETITDEAMKKNDLMILDEYMLEFAGEGKNYPAMIRMARRYNDYSIIADRVCPKYEADGLSEIIRSKLEKGDCFISWDLRLSK